MMDGYYDPNLQNIRTPTAPSIFTIGEPVQQGNQQQKQTCSGRCTKYMTIFALSMLIMISLSVNVLFCRMLHMLIYNEEINLTALVDFSSFQQTKQTQWSSSNGHETNSSSCIPSNDHRLYVDNKLHSLSFIMSLMNAEQQRYKDQRRSGVKPSGLNLYINSLSSSTIMWKCPKDKSCNISKQSAELKGDIIQIHEDGLYLLHLSLTLDKHRNSHPESNFSVKCLVGKDLRVLFEKELRLSNSDAFENVFIQDTFRLKRNDIISIYTPNINIVYNYTMTNYFGLYKIK